MAVPPPPPTTKLFVSDLPDYFDEATTQEIFGAYGTISACRMLPPRREGDKAAALIDFVDPDEAQWILSNLNGNMPEGLSEPVNVRYANSQKGKGGKGKDTGYSPPPPEAAVDDWSAGGGIDGAPPEEDGPSYGKAGKGKSWSGGKSPYNGKGVGKKGKEGHTFRNLLDGVTKGGLLPDSGQRPEDQCVYIRGLPPDTTDLDLYRMFAVFGAIPPRGVKAMLHPDGSCTSVGFVDFCDPLAAQAAIEALNDYPTADGKNLYLKTKNPHGSGKGSKKGFKGKHKGDSKGKGYLALPGPPDYGVPSR